MGIPFIQMIFVGLLPSRLKIAYYRLRGAKIGKRVRIAPLSVIISEQIEIGDDCKIGMLTFIRTRQLKLGNRVRIGTLVGIDTGIVSIGHDSVIMEQTVVGGMLSPRSLLSLGNRVKIFPYCFINPTEPIIIEDDVGVGGGTYLFTHGSWQSVLDGFPISFGPIHLRKGVWLPWRVFILPNVELGEFVTIGAGAVINKSIPPRSLAAGVPAKVISSDGGHLKPMDEEQRWQKVVSIFNEFGEFRNYSKNKTELVESDLDHQILRVFTSRQEWVDIAVCRNAMSDLNTEILISLNAIPTHVAKLLSERKVSWFDIESRRADIGALDEADQVRNYFSRFGIRFAIVTDPIFENLTS